MCQLQLFEIPEKKKKIQSGHIKRKKNKETDELKKVHHTHHQYGVTIKNSKKYIKELSQLPFDKLGKNLDIIREQMLYAFKEMNFSAYELLYEWEKQNIIARLIKFDKENIKTGNTRRQKYNRESKIN
ncbi:MAG TPA: hypothetical protein PLC59_03450 [Bacteroidales bacterium]|nr:hypothetical protein [Bacteroidales bacterium]HQI45089.1 hypothetical protein [Bacteroidales bacterium]